jgi:hypothetical protein
MRRMILFLTAAMALSVSATAAADPAFGGDHPLRLGFGLDAGLPSGIALGLVIHPKEDWATFNLALTDNALALGSRASLKLDPIALAPNCPIGLFADVQAGFAGQGSIPGHSDLPGLGYQYVNLYGGLRLGRPNGFHWNFELGPTYLSAHTNNFQSVLGSASVAGLQVGNPTVTGWVVPTFVTGFEVSWP